MSMETVDLTVVPTRHTAVLSNFLSRYVLYVYFVFRFLFNYNNVKVSHYDHICTLMKSLKNTDDPSMVTFAKHLLAQWPDVDSSGAGVMKANAIPKLISIVGHQPARNPVAQPLAQPVSKSVLKPVSKPVSQLVLSPVKKEIKTFKTQPPSPILQENDYGNVFDSDVALTLDKVAEIMIDFLEIPLPSGRDGYVLGNYFSQFHQLLWMFCFVVETTQEKKPRRKPLKQWVKDFNHEFSSGSLEFEDDAHGYVFQKVRTSCFCVAGCEVFRTDYGSSITLDEFDRGTKQIRVQKKFTLDFYCSQRYYCPESEWSYLEKSSPYVYGPVFEFIQQFGFVCRRS